MPTEKQRITVNLSDEDYQWVVNQAKLTGNSRAGILRQMVRALRLGMPELLNFGGDEMVFAEDATSTEQDEPEEEQSEETGLEAFSSG
jgi:hypothetical protein